MVFWFIPANDIDGETLLLLVQDVGEFSSIIPKAVSRLKIKSALRNYKEECVSKVGCLKITIAAINFNVLA